MFIDHCTNSTKFTIEFPWRASPDDKMAIISAAFVLDQCMFNKRWVGNLRGYLVNTLCCPFNCC